MKIFKSLSAFFEQLGRARAASTLASMGHYKLARDLMVKGDK